MKATDSAVKVYIAACGQKAYNSSATPRRTDSSETKLLIVPASPGMGRGNMKTAVACAAAKER